MFFDEGHQMNLLKTVLLELLSSLLFLDYNYDVKQAETIASEIQTGQWVATNGLLKCV